MTMNKKGTLLGVLMLNIFITLSFTFTSYAGTSTSPSTKPKPSSATGIPAGDEVSGSGTAMPDLFTGTMSYRIPIDVVPGRKGIQPNLALTYGSTNGNGWLGVGWDLGVGAIERNARDGIDFSGDDFVLAGGIDLVKVGNEYRAKIESGFSRIKQMTASDGKIYWEVTDKTGTRFLYGQAPASRQDDPSNAGNIFKWCLDHVEDANGNYMTMSYTKDQGQIYLSQINYTGNSIVSEQPTNYVKFYLEARTDAPDMYATNFRVKTAYRLKTIEVRANSNPVRAYSLVYGAYSASTGRILLASVQQHDKNATVNSSNGAVTGGSALPAITFTWPQDIDSFVNTFTANVADPGYEAGRQWADFNADGRADFCTVVGNGNYQAQCTVSTGAGFGATYSSSVLDPGWDAGRQWVDFNGDGKADFCRVVGGLGYFQMKCTVSTGTGFGATYTLDIPDPGWDAGRQWVDFNGDGKADFCTVVGNAGDYHAQCTVSTGTGFGATYSLGMSDPGYMSSWAWVDFNGDGKADFCRVVGNGAYQVLCTVSTGTGFGATYSLAMSDPGFDAGRQWVDFNGDGKADFCRVIGGSNYQAQCTLSTGTGFGATYSTIIVDPGYDAGRQWTDFNGDGKADFCRVVGNGAYQALCTVSTGAGFGETYAASIPDPGYNAGRLWVDFDGDGKSDLCRVVGNGNYQLQCTTSSNQPVDYLHSISNGFGSNKTFAYTPSTQYNNTLLPFPVQTVSSTSTSTNDGNGVVSTTNYTYSDGYYHIGDRDFRGFNHVIATGPTGPNGEQRITETWFHQGNDTAVGVNDPSASDGYMKGKPYRTIVRDGQNKIYQASETIYTTNTTTPYYYTPPQQVDTYTCDAGATVCDNSNGRHVTNFYADYDAYGNVKQEEFHGGDTDNSIDRTVTRTYGENITSWIVGLPKNETIYQGIGTTSQISKTDYYYDSTTNCNDASSNQMPTQGNVTRIVRWLDGGTSPETRMAYDAFGNPTCARDANGNISTITYDATATLPRVSTAPAPFYFQTTMLYYGIDDMAVDGLYGQLKSVTDSNGRTTTTIYDPFGRKSRVTAPDGAWTSWAYNNFGTVGSQNITTDNSEGLTSSTYFDGLGRTIVQKSDGPDSKTIAVQTQYNPTGTVKMKSLPYFDSIESARYTTFRYDPLGRVLRVDSPDQTTVLACFDNGVTVGIDTNNHRKKETKDALGRLVKVEEYTGTYASCTTEAGSPYATTLYQYDILGNLLMVTDNAGNQTIMTYDTLGRKIGMQDPDMGHWTYTYYPNGSLHTQIDPVSSTMSSMITYSYDALNRPTFKDYPTAGTHVVAYTYDETWSENPNGRLTTMTDATGNTKYYYDVMGKTKSVAKLISGQTYTMRYTYDGLGRMKTLTYPDNDVVRYDYNSGGGLLNVANNGDSTNYATYSGYNAFGQIAHVDFKNGVATDYTYRLDNNRLSSILTSKSSQPNLLDMSFIYDNVGNITNITDNTPRVSQVNYLDEIASYDYPTDHVQPHAVQQNTTDGTTYVYDLNGNMTFDGVRTITYNYDNMPTVISTSSGTTSFVYDGAGARVMKIVSQGTVVYIGKLYECKEGTCTKYIFAGSNRLAHKVGTSDVVYYHPDQLGSTSAMSDSAGVKIEDIQYYPYGETRSDSGGVSMNHKYTSQEFDAETGLYNYNARFYNPSLGRFISADTIIPDPRNPQAFNRYSYVGNNPLKYTDPSGHSSLFRDLLQLNPVLYAQVSMNDKLVQRYQWVRIGEGIAASIYVPGGAAMYAAYTTDLAGGSFKDSLKAAAIADLTAGAFELIGGMNAGSGWSTSQKVALSGMAGGVSASLQGGDFSRGFIMSAGFATAMESYKATMASELKSKYDGSGPKLLPESWEGAPKEAGVSLNSQVNNDWGTSVVPGKTPTGCDEGSTCSKIFVSIPGQEPTAQIHDVWNPAKWGDATLLQKAWFIGSAPIAAANAYAALLHGTPGVALSVEQSK